LVRPAGWGDRGLVHFVPVATT